MIQIIVNRFWIISNWKWNTALIYTKKYESQPALSYLRIIILDHFVTVHTQTHTHRINNKDHYYHKATLIIHISKVSRKVLIINYS